MLVELDHNGLVTLVRGCIPSYDQMEHWSVKGRGHFTDNNGWFWNTEILSKLSDNELYDLYNLCAGCTSLKQAKREPIIIDVCNVDENTIFQAGDTIVVPIKENCKSLYDKIQIIAYRINCYITWQSNPINQDVSYQFVANK